MTLTSMTVSTGVYAYMSTPTHIARKYIHMCLVLASPLLKRSLYLPQTQNSRFHFLCRYPYVTLCKLANAVEEQPKGSLSHEVPNRGTDDVGLGVDFQIAKRPSFCTLPSGYIGFIFWVYWDNGNILETTIIEGCCTVTVR